MALDAVAAECTIAVTAVADDNCLPTSAPSPGPNSDDGERKEDVAKAPPPVDAAEAEGPASIEKPHIPSEVGPVKTGGPGYKCVPFGSTCMKCRHQC